MGTLDLSELGMVFGLTSAVHCPGCVQKGARTTLRLLAKDVTMW